MKYLNIFVVGIALLVGGCGEKEVADEKPAKEQTSVKAPVREVSADELENREGIWYFKGEAEPFTGKIIRYSEDGSKEGEMSILDGKAHGMAIIIRKDGSREELPFVNGQSHGKAIHYNPEGEKRFEYLVNYGEQVDDSANGIRVLYNIRNGAKEEEIPYVNGLIHGVRVAYSFNIDESPIFKETTYVDDVIHGKEIFYKPDGSKLREVVFENGEEISRKEF